MADKGKCSKYRHANEFNLGDRVRVVCTGGREFFNGSHLGMEGMIGGKDISAPEYSMAHCKGGALIVQLPCHCGYRHYLFPRALEKI
jgi:hypothetical protein